MRTPQDVLQHYRNGGWVKIPYENSSLLVSMIHPEISIPDAVLPTERGLAVAEVGLLQNHVSEISDLMWDVLEHTTKNLWLEMPGGRNSPQVLLHSDSSLTGVWAKEGSLHSLLNATGKPGIVLLFEGNEQDHGHLLAQLGKVVILHPSKKTVYERSYMRMAPDGSVRMGK